MKRIPMRNLFAPTMVANGSDNLEEDPFGQGGKSSSSVPHDAVVAAIEAAAEGGTKSEIKAAAIVEGATSAQAEVLAAKAEKAAKKAGRPLGSKNSKVSAKDKKAAAKAKKESKDHPSSVGALPKDASKRIPEDAYLVKMGKGTCAYSPSKRKRYKIDGGNVIHLGRRKDSTGSSESTPASTHAASAKPASTKKSDIASALAVLSAHLGVAELKSKMPGLKIVVSDSSETKRRGRKPGTKNKPKAEQQAEAVQLAANGLARMRHELRRNSAEEAKVGPYTISLLRNPVADFKIAGIKVVPALLGATGAIVLKRGFGLIPQVNELENVAARKAVPSLLTMGLAAAAHWYAEKNGHELAADVASDVFAFGLAFAADAALESPLDKAVEFVKEKTAGTTAPAKSVSQPLTTTVAPAVAALPDAKTQSGGRFTEAPRMSGGAWKEGGANRAPAMHGYLTGKSTGYPQADLSGAAPGYPPASLYGNNGAADGVETARSISQSLSGGQFQEMPRKARKVGIDMNGFAG